MSLHHASGRWRLGLTLALTTAGCWATLPVALKVALEVVDPYTLTWFRFLVSACVVGGWVAWQGGFRPIAAMSLSRRWLLVLASVSLTANYVLYLVGLDFTTPATTQLVIQFAPMLLAAGGVLVFRERFARTQWLALVLVAAGLLCFSSDQLSVRTGGQWQTGALLIVLAAVAWAAFALAQKQLLLNLRSMAILGFIYIVASVLLLPVAAPGQLLRLDTLHAVAVAYCAFNTIAAYGAFSEALAHWDASRVGATLALTPLLTLLVMEVLARVAPGLVAPEEMSALGWAGAGLVVLGSMGVSLTGRVARQPG